MENIDFNLNSKYDIATVSTNTIALNTQAIKQIENKFSLNSVKISCFTSKNNESSVYESSSSLSNFKPRNYDKSYGNGRTRYSSNGKTAEVVPKLSVYQVPLTLKDDERKENTNSIHASSINNLGINFKESNNTIENTSEEVSHVRVNFFNSNVENSIQQSNNAVRDYNNDTFTSKISLNNNDHSVQEGNKKENSKKESKKLNVVDCNRMTYKDSNKNKNQEISKKRTSKSKKKIASKDVYDYKNNENKDIINIITNKSTTNENNDNNKYLKNINKKEGKIGCACIIF